MFMKRKKILSWSLAMAISLLLCGGGITYAKVTGPCSGCHTMHNSQDGNHMIYNPALDGNTLDGTDPIPYLTRGSCVGCHTGTNIEGSRPFVFSATEPTYGVGGNTLAGGNFYWATVDGRNGHNVKGIPSMSIDNLLNGGAPGDATGCTTPGTCHVSLFNTSVDTGCEGCHREPKHHAPQQADGAPALEVNGWFRFLSGHDDGEGDGVVGIEDDDWEYQQTAYTHNDYLGKVNPDDDGGFGFAGATANTMTAFCTGCHGYFHDQQDGSSWIRHPSDAVLGTGECASYTSYDPIVPVARPILSGFETNVVYPDNDMVMCLSCHRAHGSPYSDMLRWDYTDMVVGNNGIYAGTGCFKCHSEKDGSE